METNGLKEVRQRRYLAKDFDSFRATLLEYARLYYPDKIKDLSESSMGGLLMDFASYVGDNISFYLDHQYGELSPSSAVEDTNVERHLRSAGVPIVGAAPAIVPITMFVQVPASDTGNVIGPSLATLPVIQSNSVFESNGGTSFILVEDIDFAAKRSDGTLYADVRVGKKDQTGTPLTFLLAREGIAISGEETTENIPIGTTFVPFKRITLSNPNVTEIVTVTDGFGNSYYEVSDLTQDVVYRNVLNVGKDSELVKDALKVIPAPYRFTTEVDLSTRRTTLVLGGGGANTLEDDVIPDPSEFAISFPYTKTFSRIPVNPNQLLRTKTLGVASAGTTLSVTYRHGGGLSHNVPPGSIENVATLKMTFPGNPSPAVAGAIRSSTEVTNKIGARGGEDAPDVERLKNLIPAIKNSQERIVTRPDLLARIYTIPANFGRVYRASVRSNPNNPLATQVFIVSRDAKKRLVTSPDTLKVNLVKYLNPYRMISDAIDILDARVINLALTFDVLIDPALNRSIVLQTALAKLQKTFDVKHANIDQPILISNVRNTVFSVPGIISINDISFTNMSGIVANKQYSDVVYDINANTKQGIIFPPSGGIFEIRYPEVDIIGRTSK